METPSQLLDKSRELTDDERQSSTKDVARKGKEWKEKEIREQELKDG
jgi:hypothetical protein